MLALLDLILCFVSHEDCQMIVFSGIFGIGHFKFWGLLSNVPTVLTKCQSLALPDCRKWSDHPFPNIQALQPLFFSTQKECMEE